MTPFSCTSVWGRRSDGLVSAPAGLLRCGPVVVSFCVCLFRSRGNLLAPVFLLLVVFFVLGLQWGRGNAID